MKIYQVHLPPTAQFIHGVIFGYDALMFLKVGFTILSLKWKLFNLYEHFYTFCKDNMTSFSKIPFFCFCTVNNFLYISENILSASAPTAQFIHGLIFGYDALVFLKVGCTFLSLKLKLFNLYERFYTFWKAHMTSFSKSTFFLFSYLK